MSRLETLIPRPNGAEVMIVAQASFRADMKFAADVFVLRRENVNDNWRVLSDTPHPDWRTMSVDEYVKHGRSEKLQNVTHGQIFKAAQALRTQMGM